MSTPLSTRRPAPPAVTEREHRARPGVRPDPSWPRRGLLIGLLLAFGCQGTISGGAGDVATDHGDGGSTPPATGDASWEPLTLPPATLKLLPFDVRLRRIADAVGLPVTDSVFDTARKNRLALGAHDFANSTAPDLSWNAQRMAFWAEAMLPVCRDSRVRSNLGDWRQGGVERFVQAAFGRASVAEDLDDLATTLDVGGDDGWVATCLTLTSAAEVMVQ